ncbi:MAG TPA: hypothetical protein VJM49_11170 [Acidimicrobiales bacterium]|nr:hypothetical protein [Acidimicrobiales bacterium]
MTLAVTVVCQDGVVVAADSRTTLGNHRMLRVGSDFTHKVFASGEVAVATYGEAFVDDRSIASHMAEFAVVEAGNCAHPGPVAERLAAFFGDRYDAQWVDAPDDDEGAPPPGVAALGFLVSGYDDAGLGEAWEVTLPDRAVEQIATTANGGGAAWRGQSDVVTRIVRGADLELLARLAAHNKMTGDLDVVMPLLDECSYRIPFDSMNLQDGIDFAVLCIRTTIDVQRLTLGPLATSPEFSWPGVGGPIEIATVTATGGFRWVQRTSVQGERPAGMAEGQG